MDVYVYMQGQRRGPYERAQLEEMWNRGQIPADAFVLARWYAPVGSDLRFVRKHQDGASFEYRRRQRRVDDVSRRIVNGELPHVSERGQLVASAASTSGKI